MGRGCLDDVVRLRFQSSFVTEKNCLARVFKCLYLGMMLLNVSTKLWNLC
jgi:hypothetical protein